MSTSDIIQIGNLEIDLIRKDIKNMHLAVYPPNGRIRLSAPENTDREIIRLFAVSKLGWIKKHVQNFKEQERETPRQYVSRETHYVWGKRYLLEMEEGSPKVFTKGKKLFLQTPPSSSSPDRARMLQEWYRKQLKNVIPGLLQKWEKEIGVKADDWRVQRMRTKWGSCNPVTGRILLNLELAKKPKICLEYIIVHELTHLLERNHTDRFIALMDLHMPKWRMHRKELNRLPVRHEEWGY